MENAVCDKLRDLATRFVDIVIHNVVHLNSEKTLECNDRNNQLRDLATDFVDSVLYNVLGYNPYRTLECNGVVSVETCSLYPEEVAMQTGDDADSDKDAWWLDSGASRHMSGEKSDFIDYQKEKPGLVTLADKSQITSLGKGDVDAKIFGGGDGTVPVR